MDGLPYESLDSDTVSTLKSTFSAQQMENRTPKEVTRVCHALFKSSARGVFKTLDQSLRQKAQENLILLFQTQRKRLQLEGLLDFRSILGLESKILRIFLLFQFVRPK